MYNLKVYLRFDQKVDLFVMLLFTLALNYAVSARNNWIEIDATSSSAVFPSTGATGETQSQMRRLTTYENKIAELELKLKGMY